MNRPSKIGAGQLFLFILLSRVVITLTYSINSGGHTIDNADWLAALFMPLVLLVLGIPAFYFLKVSKNCTICDYAYTIGKPMGIIVSVLYALLFFALAYTSVARFSFFVTSTMQTEQGSWFFPILIMLPVCFAAIKGMQAIVRTGAVLTIISLLSILAIILALIPRFDSLNIITPLYNGWKAVGNSILLMLSNSMELSMVLMLAPYVRGNIKGAYLAYAAVAPIFLFIVFFTIMAVLGSHGTLQLFPFYSVAGIAKVGELSNLSALEASVWILGVFMKSSMHLYLCFQCLSKIIPDKFRSLSILLLAILGAAVAAIGSDNVTKAQLNFSIPTMLTVNLFFVMVLPCIIMAIGFIKRRITVEKNRQPAR